MTIKEIYEALSNGATIERVYNHSENILYKLVNGELMAQYCNTKGFVKRSDRSFATEGFLYQLAYSLDKLRIYKEPKIITIDGKDIKISEESFNELKRQLGGK